MDNQKEQNQVEKVVGNDAFIRSCNILMPNTVVAEHYRIEKLIQSGQFSDSYLAKELLLDRIVVLKVLHDLDNKEAKEDSVQRLKNEALNLSKIVHPGIVRMHACELLENNRLFQVTEFQEGETLRKFLDREKFMPPCMFFSTFIDLAEALKYAHDRDIVHRNINPDNIILIGSKAKEGQETQKQNKALLTNFQFSKFVIAAASQSSTKTLDQIRDSFYLSPELMNKQKIDKKTDIYALGLVMYECLLGKPALYQLVGAKEETVSETKTDQQAKVTKTLLVTVKKCIEKDPNSRLDDLAPLIEALRFEQECKLKESRVNTNKLRQNLGLCLGFLALSILAFVILSKNVSNNSLATSLGIDPSKYLDNKKKTESKLVPALAVPVSSHLKDLLHLLKIYDASINPSKDKEIILRRWIEQFGRQKGIDNIEKREVFRRFLTALRKDGKLEEAEKFRLWFQPFTESLPDMAFYVAEDAAIKIDKGKYQEAISLIEETKQLLIQNEGYDKFMRYGADLFLAEAYAYAKQKDYASVHQCLQPAVDYHLENSERNRKRIRHIILENSRDKHMIVTRDLVSKVIHTYIKASLLSKKLSSESLDSLSNYLLLRAESFQGLCETQSQVFEQIARDCQEANRQDLANRYLSKAEKAEN